MSYLMGFVVILAEIEILSRQEIIYPKMIHHTLLRMNIKHI